MKRVFTLTPAEMLFLWRSRRLYEPLAAGGTEVSRSDSPAVEARLMSIVRSAYARAVEESEPADLPLAEIAPQLSIEVDAAGVGTARLPDGVIRVESVICDAWLAPARIADPTDTATVARQANPFSRGGRAEPVAIVIPDRMLLYSFRPDEKPAVTSCMAVCMPGPDDDFIFTSSLLSKTLSYDIS
ncbi:MAG: hypothetical protein K2H74_03755 [Paramuribaculum sp.]|nr:hypothetical protein [Paramuribaculum sp.]